MATIIASAVPREFMKFALGQEQYGIDIRAVQEIRSYEAPTAIADAPPHVLGVTNLRGVIVPIVDLRLQFGMDKWQPDEQTVVIVVEVEKRLAGFVVDRVLDVAQLGAEQIKPAPAMSLASGRSFISAIGTLDQEILILLDVDRLLTFGAEAAGDVRQAA